MSDYTPTTEEIAGWWAHKGGSTASPYYASKLTKRAKEFDRWLAAHDAEKRAEWEAEKGGHVVPCARCGQRRVVASDAINSDIEVCGRCGTEIGLHELAEQGETEWEVEHGLLVKIGGNWAETEWEPEQFDEVVAGYPHNEYVRAERKVTPWLPVPGSTVRESDSGVRDSDSEESEGKA